jgi:hypothetical protein
MVVEHGNPMVYSIHYVKAGIYMTITTKEKSDFLLNMAKQFCLNIGAKIELQ